MICSRAYAAVVAALLILANISVAVAQGSSTLSPADAWAAAMKTAVKGPAEVPLGLQAKLKLPEGELFFSRETSLDVMSSWGNSRSSTLMGMIVPADDAKYWAISVDFIPDGYVKEDDAKDWNADDLLQSLKDGTEAQNEERIKQGFPPLDIVGWVQPPTYDTKNHRLVWSLKAVDRGAPADQDATVNYNTYAPGREGYFELNLLTTDRNVAADKPQALALLAALNYNDGKRYEDFNSATDHVAEYGLAALIAGVAAKKLGFLALIGLFFAKFFKVILVAVAVAGAGVVKLFRRNRSNA